MYVNLLLFCLYRLCRKLCKLWFKRSLIISCHAIAWSGRHRNSFVRPDVRPQSRVSVCGRRISELTDRWIQLMVAMDSWHDVIVPPPFNFDIGPIFSPFWPFWNLAFSSLMVVTLWATDLRTDRPLNSVHGCNEQMTWCSFASNFDLGPFLALFCPSETWHFSFKFDEQSVGDMGSLWAFYIYLCYGSLGPQILKLFVPNYFIQMLKQLFSHKTSCI